MDKVNPEKQPKKQTARPSEWKAGEDVEALGTMLTKYLTNASQFAHLQVSTGQRPSSKMEDGVTASHVDI